MSAELFHRHGYLTLNNLIYEVNLHDKNYYLVKPRIRTLY